MSSNQFTVVCAPYNIETPEGMANLAQYLKDKTKPGFPAPIITNLSWREDHLTGVVTVQRVLCTTFF